jgi:protein transport protein YIF1
MDGRYKYVALVLNMLLGVFLGTGAYTVALLYTGSAMAYFMLRTMSAAVPRGNHGQQGPNKREFMLMGFAAMQMVTIWWLGYSRDLKKSP